MQMLQPFRSLAFFREPALASDAFNLVKRRPLLKPSHELAVDREQTAHAMHVRSRSAGFRRIRAPMRASDDPTLRPGVIELMLMSGAR